MTQGSLNIHELQVRYRGGAHAVRGVSLRVAPGSTLAIVGESGSGKSTILNAALGLLPDGARASGSIQLDGADLLQANERALRRVRGRLIGYVPQNPFHALDPLRRVRAHVTDAARVHGVRLDHDQVRERLVAVGIAPAYADGRAYPHQWSGGMLQRACIAAALVHDPPVLLADEPTSALDRATSRTVLDQMVRTRRTAIIVTHDVEIAAAVADDVAVMYAGRIVETGVAADVLAAPRHPYTAALIEAVPRVSGVLPEGLDGSPPALSEPDSGCAFRPRCSYTDHACIDIPELADGVRCHHALDGGRA